MNSLQTLVHWLTQDPFTAVGVVIGGLIVAVTLYTYLYDYTMLTNRDQAGK